MAGLRGAASGFVNLLLVSSSPKEDLMRPNRAPADELADIRSEIRRLKARDTGTDQNMK